MEAEGQKEAFQGRVLISGPTYKKYIFGQTSDRASESFVGTRWSACLYTRQLA